MTYTAVDNKAATEMFWLHIWGALTLSIFTVYVANVSKLWQTLKSCGRHWLTLADISY